MVLQTVEFFGAGYIEFGSLLAIMVVAHYQLNMIVRRKTAVSNFSFIGTGTEKIIGYLVV